MNKQAYDEWHEAVNSAGSFATYFHREIDAGRKPRLHMEHFPGIPTEGFMEFETDAERCHITMYFPGAMNWTISIPWKDTTALSHLLLRASSAVKHLALIEEQTGGEPWI